MHVTSCSARVGMCRVHARFKALSARQLKVKLEMRQQGFIAENAEKSL